MKLDLYFKNNGRYNKFCNFVNADVRFIKIKPLNIKFFDK